MKTPNLQAPTPSPVEQMQPLEASIRTLGAEIASAQWNGSRAQTETHQTLDDEGQYRSLITNLPCLIYRCANDANWTAEFVSEGCEQILGCPASEFMSSQKRSLASFVAPDDRKGVDRQIEQAFAQGSAYQLEYRLIHADGSEHWVADRGQVVISENGLPCWRDGVLFDISEQKQREAILTKVNKELTESARLTGEFLANVSHEIRTPLSVILTIAESLQEGIYGAATARQVDALGRLRRSGRHLLGLVNDILDMAKMEVGKLKLHLGRIAVQTVCTHSLQIMQELAQTKDIHLTYVNRNGAEYLWADEQRLSQILVNLITNAIKFTPPGGKVGLEVTANPGDEVIRFTVWDTGIGIAKEETAQIFQPFIQLDTKLSRQYEGTGLGLALVYHLTRLHGGGITLETAEGQGSRFIIALPWREDGKANTVDRETTSSSTLLHPKPRILMIEEDETGTQKLITELRTHNFCVSATNNLQRAISLASEEPPDLVLITVPMPDFKIIETTRQLRARGALPTTPILAITTLTLPCHQALWQQAGIAAALSKPISLKQLAATIHTYLS